MNPVLFKLGNIEVKWYSFLLLIGMLLAIIMVMRESKRFRISKDFTFNLCFWTVIIGIIGARLYYCIFNFSYFKDHPTDIIKIWEGGLAIHGGLIAGLITLSIYCRRYNIKVLKMTDITVVPLLLAQAIGRWGNFFNSEAHGSATTYYHLKELKVIPEQVIQGMNINNTFYHPTFYYESMLCLIGFIILFFLRRYKYLKRGQLTCIYLMYYGVIRFFIESLRDDSLMFGGFRVAQIVSIIMFVVGLLIFMVISRKGRFEDLYNEEQTEPSRF